MPHTHSTRSPQLPLRRLLRLPILLLCLSLPACAPVYNNSQGAHQSLVEIGERSLELAEAKENARRTAEANASYRRALWAFTYHLHLTGEEPLLMEEAEDGLRRTSKE